MAGSLVGLTAFFYLLVVFVTVDYVTGLMCAGVSHSLSSARGMKGILKKGSDFSVGGARPWCRLIAGGSWCPGADGSNFFYLSNEGISVLEKRSHDGASYSTAIAKSPASTRKRGGRS